MAHGVIQGRGYFLREQASAICFDNLKSKGNDLNRSKPMVKIRRRFTFDPNSRANFSLSSNNRLAMPCPRNLSEI